MKNTLRLVFLSLVTAGSFGIVAQDLPPRPEERTVAGPVGEVQTGIGRGLRNVDGVEDNLPRAKVRGRVFSADTGAPIRYTEIGFIRSDNPTSFVRKTVKTDENGEYLYEGLLAGSYYAYVKNDGLIKPNAFMPQRLREAFADDKQSAPRLEQYFQKLVVQGDGTFNFDISVRRGAAISGFVEYFDREPAANLEVFLATEFNGIWSPVRSFGVNSPYKTSTDDLGYYRFSGLLPGEYKVFVREPVRHKKNESEVRRFTSILTQDDFSTFYSAQDNSAGDVLEVFPAQFIEDINITLPERKLYDISGIIVDKSTGRRLEGFSVNFTRIIPAEEDPEGALKGTLAQISTALIGRIGRSGQKYPAEWELKNLLPGKYRITATQARRTGSKEKEVVQYPSVSREIEIVDSDIPNIVIEVPIGGKLEIQLVTDDSKTVSGFTQLLLENANTGEMNPQVVNPRTENGKQIADVGSIASGEYKLTVVTRGYFVERVEGSSVRSGVLTIEDGDRINDVKVYLSSRFAVVKGRVNGVEPGKEALVIPVIPGEDTFASMMRIGAGGRQNEMRKDGTFELRVAPGEYALVVITREEIGSNPQRILDLVKERTPSAVRFTVGAGETVNMDVRK